MKIDENIKIKDLMKTASGNDIISRMFYALGLDERIVYLPFISSIKLKDLPRLSMGKIDEDMLIYMYEELFEKQAKQIGIKSVIETKNYIELCFPEDVVKQLDTEELFLESFKITNMLRFKSRGSNLLIILDTIKLSTSFI